jgi:hypothetical protein
MKKFFLLPVLLAFTAQLAAFAGVTINSPGNSANVSSPFSLSAVASTCSSQSVSAMGYSLDNSTDTSVEEGMSVNAQVAAGTGAHIVHVKAWGNQGAACDSDVAITVTGGANAALVPSLSANVSSIESLSNWIGVFDVATSGSATGGTSIVSSPSQSGHARAFTTSYTNAGGARFSVSFGDDETSTNFFYDGWVYLNNSAGQIANLELDMNQTMENGQTALFGFQCDGYTSTWDYTQNAGTPTSPKDQWVHSGAFCNPRSWSINTWHHVQVYYSRDNSGNITYHSVWLDGAQQNINATVNSAFALGWAPTLTTNVQVDGLGSGGSVTVYVDNLTVYHW